MNRPEPSWPAAPGFKHVAVRDNGWRMGGRGHRCRWSDGGVRCENDAEVELCRGFVRRQWWAYCAEHMYGRWIEDGAVMQWVLRPITEATLTTGP